MRVTREMKERIENGFDLSVEKNGKEFYFFKEEDGCWNCDISVDGEIEETNFFETNEEVIEEIKRI